MRTGAPIWRVSTTSATSKGSCSTRPPVPTRSTSTEFRRGSPGCRRSSRPCVRAVRQKFVHPPRARDARVESYLSRRCTVRGTLAVFFYCSTNFCTSYMVILSERASAVLKNPHAITAAPASISPLNFMICSCLLFTRKKVRLSLHRIIIMEKLRWLKF